MEDERHKGGNATTGRHSPTVLLSGIFVAVGHEWCYGKGYAKLLRLERKTQDAARFGMREQAT